MLIWSVCKFNNSSSKVLTTSVSLGYSYCWKDLPCTKEESCPSSFHSLVVDLPYWIPPNTPFSMLALEVFRVESWFLLSFSAKHLLLFEWSPFSILVMILWPWSRVSSIPLRGCFRGHRASPLICCSCQLTSHCWSLRVQVDLRSSWVYPPQS